MPHSCTRVCFGQEVCLEQYNKDLYRMAVPFSLTAFKKLGTRTACRRTRTAWSSRRRPACSRDPDRSWARSRRRLAKMRQILKNSLTTLQCLVHTPFNVKMCHTHSQSRDIHFSARWATLHKPADGRPKIIAIWSRDPPGLNSH